MQIHCLQHVAFETPGNIETWAKEKGHAISFTRFFEGEPLPSTNDFDALLILGGFMSVHDEMDFPWLRAEKQLIAEAIRLRKKVLGICLGSQLIAAVLGARVYPNAFKEIGFMPVFFAGKARQHPLLSGFPARLSVFHWHGETFDLPEKALLLASNLACQNQAFLIGDHILGIQFHLEINATIIRDMVSHDKEELVPAPYIHSAEKILGDLQFIDPCQNHLFVLLDRFFGKKELPE
jgi:GMP synthase-like glutamine amidotransferase